MIATIAPQKWQTLPDRDCLRLPALLVVTAIAALSAMRLVGSTDAYVRLFPPPAGNSAAATYWRLMGMAWWAGVAVTAYGLLPLAMTRLWLGDSLRWRDWHVRPAFHGRAALMLYAAVLPALWWASSQPEFILTYPMYRLASRSLFDFASWEALYMAQFVALEFFFRGFLLAGLRRVTGSAVVAVGLAALPYTLIHSGKPAAEFAASAGAGVILGILALRTGSIWSGVALHGAAALTMDILALQKETIPT